jgi:hypothetical protein
VLAKSPEEEEEEEEEEGVYSEERRRRRTRVQFLYQAQISTPPQDSVPPGTESVHLPRFELPEGGSKEKNMAWGSREGWC